LQQEALKNRQKTVKRNKNSICALGENGAVPASRPAPRLEEELP
jgi:hypothetical protein